MQAFRKALTGSLADFLDDETQAIFSKLGALTLIYQPINALIVGMFWCARKGNSIANIIHAGDVIQ
jgi:hypothetical protein